jgi:hypothetical protein
VTMTAAIAAALTVLTEALDDPDTDTDIAHSLRLLTLDAATAVASYRGLSALIGRGYTPQQADWQLDVQAANNRTDRHAAALHILAKSPPPATTTDTSTFTESHGERHRLEHVTRSTLSDIAQIPCEVADSTVSVGRLRRCPRRRAVRLG